MEKCMIGQGSHIITVCGSKKQALEFLNNELFKDSDANYCEYESDYIFYKENIWICPCGETEYPFL